MTISVTYNSVYGDISVKEVLSAWSAGFKTAGHGESNTGGFNTGARSYDGEQYATHGANGSDYAFIAESNASNGLHYVYNPDLPASSNQNHFLWGQLDNVKLGEVLTGGSGSPFGFDDYTVSFNGLDLSAASDAGRAGNAVQDVIYGLMRGNVAGLEGVLNTLLSEFNLSTDSTFDQLAAAGLAHADTAFAADIGLVGVQDAAQDWALTA
ncbi:MAG: heme acquisition protein HasA [Pseudomonas helleri]|uniref:Heme-binding protein n=1 Tax=Pseudomonas helleri TaxID=1608996 RepID=A0A7X2CK21_9PSED|nr:heme acquisition protein HasA [Pseudomonas helleri]MQT96029.1 heme-binding protein [Pseudomonas helleri]MQU33666.1 heme-binding protein [Pseudomonas helleri]